MGYQSVIKHMNDDHVAELLALARKFGKSDASVAVLVSVDFGGLDIVYDGDQKLRIDFPSPAYDSASLKKAIINLCKINCY